MALAVSLVFTFRDNKGDSAITKLRIPTGFTIAQMLEFGEAAAQLLSNLSSAQMTKASISVGVDLSGATIRAVASATSDVFQKALFVARSNIAGLFARFNFPTLQDDKVVDGTDQLDTADADVAAVITALEDGIVTGTPAIAVPPTDLRNNGLAEVTTTREIFRKS